MKKLLLALLCSLMWASSAFALTLGDTNSGASCDAGSTQMAATWDSTESDDFTSVSVNASEDGNNGYQFKAAIWANSSGVPGSRLTIAGTAIDLPNGSGSNCSAVSYV